MVLLTTSMIAPAKNYFMQACRKDTAVHEAEAAGLKVSDFVVLRSLTDGNIVPDELHMKP